MTDENTQRTSKQESYTMEVYRQRHGSLMHAAVVTAIERQDDEMERLQRESEIRRKEHLETCKTVDRLRAALAGLKDLTCNECVPCKRINAEIDRALSGEHSEEKNDG